MSKRQQKKAAREGAHALRQRAGWDPKKVGSVSPEAALRDLSQREHTDSAYDASDACPDCKTARQRLDDETALCEKHLSEAMGVS